ncbi:MAG: hypothetical protein ACOCV4_07460 [Myxococcota bacterium]
MLTPDQVARRVDQERDTPGVVVVEAEQVSAAGDVVCSEEQMAALTGAGRVVAVIRHLDAGGRPRLVCDCGAQASARGVVRRVVSELAVIDLTDEGPVVREVAPGTSAREVQAVSEPTLWAEPDLAVVEA